MREYMEMVILGHDLVSRFLPGSYIEMHSQSKIGLNGSVYQIRTGLNLTDPIKQHLHTILNTVLKPFRSPGSCLR